MTQTKVTPLEWNVKEIMKARAEHLEMYCAAFIKEVGPISVLEYELVEQIESNPIDGIIQRVTWRFRKKES
jgi:hypothetical protein